MQTKHIILNQSLSDKNNIDSESVDLIVTSPPYPMIEMWDDCFKSQNKKISEHIDKKDFYKAWKEMHEVLNRVWKECIRVLKPGGIICVNIGDATRTLDNNFQLFPNKVPITNYFLMNGCIALPEIIWRKQTNAPNKFMGSGMYAPGAYITLEHEYILIFRKGCKREFKGIEKDIRRRSAYFYNERNVWFSDLWDFKGISQKGIKGSRERNGSYPLELPNRLINMFSIQGDTVLDPFAGLGTTMVSAIINGRNSINCEIDPILCKYMKQRVSDFDNWNYYREERLKKQLDSIIIDKEKGKDLYYNSDMLINVKTRQEKDIILPEILSVSVDNEISVEYNENVL